MTREWSDEEKAQWYLEHGYPKILWVNERVADIVYKRPTCHTGPLPPWIDPRKREIDYIWSDYKK